MGVQVPNSAFSRRTTSSIADPTVPTVPTVPMESTPLILDTMASIPLNLNPMDMRRIADASPSRRLLAQNVSDKEVHDSGIRLKAKGSALILLGSLAAVVTFASLNPFFLLGALLIIPGMKMRAEGEVTVRRSNFDCGYCGTCAPMD